MIKMKSIVKFINIASLLLCLLIFSAGLIRTIKSPDNEIVYENRPAESFPQLSVSAYSDKSFQDSVEKALSDQVHAAIKMKKMYNIIDAGCALPFIDSMKSTENAYIAFRDIYFYKDMLVVRPKSISENKAYIDDGIARLNTHIANMPETKFYAYYIETDKDIDFVTGSKTGMFEHICSGLDLPKQNIARLEISNYDDYRNNFLCTDHHWNASGAYSAYSAICQMLGIETLPVHGQHIIEGRYLGTRSAGIEGIKPESFSVNIFDFPEMEITANGNPATDYGQQSQFIANELDSFSYGSVFGPDCAEIIFDTGKEGESLLIMGDSYDNALLKALACGFSQTYSVDLRAYDQLSFDIEGYVSNHDIDIVLYIGGVDYFSTILY